MNEISLFNLREKADELLEFLSKVQTTDILSILEDMKNFRRYSKVDSKLYFNFKGTEYEDRAFEIAIRKMNGILKSIYKDEIESLPKIFEKGGVYHLCNSSSKFEADEVVNLSVVESTIHYLEDGKTVEECFNGLICKGFIPNKAVYHDSDKLDSILNGSWYQFYNNEGKVGRRDYFTTPKDGVSENMLEENILLGRKEEVKHNNYSNEILQLGNAKGGRYTFVVGSRTYDNEPEAAFSCYSQNNKTSVGIEEEYIFNPVLNHVNQLDALDRYIKGELTKRDLLLETLEDVARNPFLILKYNLMQLCEDNKVSVAGFQINNNGLMVNQYNVSYSVMADYYFKGKLTRDEIRNQENISSLETLKIL
jgi:hypothetical protein